MCISPTFVWMERGPKWEPQPVSCRKCWRCRSNRVSDYVGRALCEAAMSDWTVALTLTYAPRLADEVSDRTDRDDLADKVLTLEHFQNFMKLFRWNGSEKKRDSPNYSVRYLVAGEYGELRGRAHFHVILFGRGQRPEIAQKRRTHIPEWPHGHVFADWDADEKALRYVAKYILKYEDSGAQKEHWFSFSKVPALGWDWFAAKADEAVSLGVMPSSFNYLPPGGHKGRPYLMTGATRRDYIKRITEGLRRQGMDPAPDTLNEYVFRAVHRNDVDAWLAEIEATPLEDQKAALVANIERQRPSTRQIVAQGWKALDKDGSFPANMRHLLKEAGRWHGREELEPDSDEPQGVSETRPSCPPQPSPNAKRAWDRQSSKPRGRVVRPKPKCRTFYTPAEDAPPRSSQRQPPPALSQRTGKKRGHPRMNPATASPEL